MAKIKELPLSLLMTLAVAGTASAAAAAPQTEPATARGVVESIIEKARKLDDRANRARNETAIEGMVDFQKLFSEAMGSRLSQATPEQAARIRELLRQIITRTVYPQAPRFFRDVKVAFTGEETNEGTVHITSAVTKGRKRSTVEYWLTEEGSRFRVVDLAVEGARWVENVHNQFDEIIGRHGMTGLIERMEKRVAKLSKS